MNEPVNTHTTIQEDYLNTKNCELVDNERSSDTFGSYPHKQARLEIFNTKVRKSKGNGYSSPQENNLKSEINKNFAGKPKHYPPANKEWLNSIYSYNKNSTKLLPVSVKVIFRLVKSYFNFYSRKLEKKIKTHRLRIRARRLSTNRILVSKPEIKHTNDKSIITIYIYNRQKKYYLNKLKRIASIDKMDELLSNRVKKELKQTNGPWPSNLKIENLKKESVKLISKLKKHKNVALKMLKPLQNTNKTHCFNFEDYNVKYLKNYVYKSLRKEILSIYYRQLISFNKSKFEEKYILPLKSIIKKICKKEVEFNLVNLKYLYQNSHIFTETLITKLRNRKNKPLRVLGSSLLMFKLPLMDRTAVYDEIYNRKRKLQNLKISTSLENNLTLDLVDKVQFKDEDILQLSLSKLDIFKHMSKLNNYTINWQNNLLSFKYPLHITNSIIKLIKNKYVSGIRLEMAGRLTRRNTAARAVFKLRYKGNIKNMDSSYKGLPSVLLRGYAKSNLQYSSLKSKRRIGAFGLKGWVNSS